jgi:hypothetical protein
VRSFSILTAFIGAVIGAAWLTGATVPFRNDFAAYWPVGRLLLTGKNPYDPVAIATIQRSVGDLLGGDSLVRYPPWSIPLLIPGSLLPYAPAWYGWIALQSLMVGGAAIWFWNMLGGSGARTPLLIGFGFPAGLFVALGGQIDGLLLLLAATFLWGLLTRRDILAGLSLGLLSMKPHLFMPLGLVAILWGIGERRWRIFLGVAVVLAVGSWTAIALRPEVYADYWKLLQTPGTSWRRAVAVGTGISQALNGRASWLQWLPSIVIGPIVLFLWPLYRKHFDWRRELGFLLTLGLLSAPYLLVHDLVLLVPGLLTIALCVGTSPHGGRRWVMMATFLVMCGIVWYGQISGTAATINVWIVPLMLLPIARSRACVVSGVGGGGGG